MSLLKLNSLSKSLGTLLSEAVWGLIAAFADAAAAQPEHHFLRREWAPFLLLQGVKGGNTLSVTAEWKSINIKKKKKKKAAAWLEKIHNGGPEYMQGLRKWIGKAGLEPQLLSGTPGGHQGPLSRSPSAPPLPNELAINTSLPPTQVHGSIGAPMHP